jgi:hypothetical protein
MQDEFNKMMDRVQAEIELSKHNKIWKK